MSDEEEIDETFESFCLHYDTVDINSDDRSIEEIASIPKDCEKKDKKIYLQLKADKKEEDILNYIKIKNEDLENKFKNKLQNELIKQNQKIEIEEGVTTCKNCSSKRILTYQMQTRSGDEAMTTFYVCTNCATKWKS